VVQRVGFPQVVGIAELPDEIRRMLKSADIRKWTRSRDISLADRPSLTGSICKDALPVQGAS
jgi:hypothetical protein